MRKSVEKKLDFFGKQDAGDSEHSTILPIWVGSQLRLVRVRLIGGDAELLLGFNIFGNCV